MAGLSCLVSGYGSDSEEDQDQQGNTAASSSNSKQNQTIKSTNPNSTSTSKSSLFNSLPSPSNPNPTSSNHSTGISSKLALPPPSTSSSSSRLGLPPPNNPTSSSSSSSNPTTKKRKDKGKLQIGIQSLSSLEKSTSDDEDEDETKPTLSSNSNGSGKPSHSLFGLLPAPKRPKIDEQVEALKNQGAIRIKEVDVDEIGDSNQDGDGDGNEPPKKKVKGNNDFRAMLGLKSNGKDKEKRNVEKKQEVKKVETVPSNGASSVHSQMSKKVESAPQKDEQPQENSDFFSLGPKPNSSTTSKHHLHSTPTFQISSAPIFEEESLPPVPTDPTDPINPYRGWNQDPDGSWVPITPEAWSAYNLYLSTQSQSQSTSTSSSIPKKNPISSETGGGGGFSSSELEKYGLKEEDLESVDAGEIAARAFALRGVNDLNPTPIGSSSTSGSGLTNGMNSKDKMKFNKARGKGQLSSLIAHANERRGDLEQKWSEGKDKQRQGGAKYGF